MPKFAANLSMLWQELDPYARFHAAADAGFTNVEMLFPHELEQDRLEDFDPGATAASHGGVRPGGGRLGRG